MQHIEKNQRKDENLIEIGYKKNTRLLSGGGMFNSEYKLSVLASWVFLSLQLKM